MKKQKAAKRRRKRRKHNLIRREVSEFLNTVILLETLGKLIAQNKLEPFELNEEEIREIRRGFRYEFTPND